MCIIHTHSLLQIFGTDNVLYVRETSLVDPETKEYTATSKNLTYSNLITLEERISYQADPDATDEKTLLKQEAIVVALGGGLASIRSHIEDFCVNRCRVNAEKGRKGLEEVIKSLSQQKEEDKMSS